MNIFILDHDIDKCAEYHVDKHIVKMPLESAQMLCTAHHHYGNGDNVPYKKAHYNHPSTIWVRDNCENYAWLYRHMLALGEEYTKRYGKTHLTITKCKEPLSKAPPGMPWLGFTQPPQAMPDEYKNKCAVKAYRAYYNGEKSYFAKWTTRDTPEWFQIE